MNGIYENDICIICFTDGACSNNGKKEAISSYADVFPYHEEFNSAGIVPGDHHTNNRGEFYALIEAFKQADLIDPTKSKILVVYTDSKLLVDTVNIYISWWKNIFRWKKSNKEDIANIDLVREIDRLKTARTLYIEHVRGHRRNKDWKATYNTKADKLAREALTDAHIREERHVMRNGMVFTSTSIETDRQT